MKRQNYQAVVQPNWLKVLSYILLAKFIAIIFILTFVPWQQTSKGSGKVVAFDTNNRVQEIHSPVNGIVKKWFVNDGSFVKKGDKIVQITDNDPDYITRLTRERDNLRGQLSSVTLSKKISLSNLERQKKLHRRGLASKLSVEKASMAYQKRKIEESKIANKLTKSEVKLAQQENQIIRAPRDGTILRLLHGSETLMIKKGAYLATFVPHVNKQSVELFIAANDLPLISIGREVRLQFEGWPAIQFSGWPSVAKGTFQGVVRQIDPSIETNGKFRVLIVEKNEKWPDKSILRQGTKVYGWILLDTVKLGYEFWRKINGFPISVSEKPEPQKKMVKK